MSSNTIFFAWKRSQPGREHISAAHFEEMMRYYTGLQQAGVVQSFEPVLLDPNGSGVNGFFMIKVEESKLPELLARQDFHDHVTRSILHLEDPVLSYGVSGPAVGKQMESWVASIPR
jgi:hypothetical protein